VHEVDGQTLLVKGPRGVPHRLNTAGAALWRCFDGKATLAVIADDLAAVLGVPVDTVRVDVVDLARQLGAAGLLSGVDSAVPSSPELDLIHTAARRSLDLTGGEPAPGSAAPDGLDWDLLEALALGHRLAGPTLDLLAGQDAAPAALLAGLAARREADVAHATALAAHLIDVVDLLAAHGVDALAFKGPVLAVTVFGDLHARAFRDLDLLVAPGQYRRAHDVLVAHGHVDPDPPRRGRSLRSHEVALTARRGTVEIEVDLHRALAPRGFHCQVPFRDLWARRITVELPAGAVPGPSLDDTLWLASLQLAKDAWERRLVLSKVVDLAAIVTGRPGPDIDGVAHRGENRGQEQILAFALDLTDEVLGPFPSASHVWHPRPTAATRVRVTEARRDLAVGGSPRGGLRRARFHADLRERQRDRAGPYVRWFVTPTDEDLDRVALPARLNGLHWILRPARLSAEAVRTWRSHHRP
jgi:hypothetical protein